MVIIVLLLTLFIGRVISVDLNENIHDTIGPYAVRVGKTIVYIKDGQRASFPDSYTFHYMGYHFDSLPHAERHAVDSLPWNHSIVPSKFDNHPNQKILSCGESEFILKDEKVFSLLNPSYVYYHDYILLSWRYKEHDFRVIAIPRPSKSMKTQLRRSLTDSKEGHFIDTLANKPPTTLTAHEIEQDIAFLKTIDAHDSKYSYIDLHGEDPRLFIAQNYHNQSTSAWIAYCQRYRRVKPELQMSYVQIAVENVQDTVRLVHDTVQDIHFELERGKEDQKNWTPLLIDYATDSKKKSIHYLSTPIAPHRVVELSPGWKTGKHLAHTIGGSFTEDNNKVNITVLQSHWPYGELRGGTSAQMIEQGKYLLGFFHSSTEPPASLVGPDILKTYVMGAYLLCNKAPDYKVIKLSSKPIITKAMYTGNWVNNPIAYHHIDYVVFPMSFLISNENKVEDKKIYLLYGKQDQEGWMVTLQYQRLLDSLIAVQNITTSSLEDC